MARKLAAIPKTNTGIAKNIVAIINPIREAIELRFLGSRTGESAVTVNDLVKLGLISASDINKLDE